MGRIVEYRAAYTDRAIMLCDRHANDDDAGFPLGPVLSATSRGMPCAACERIFAVASRVIDEAGQAGGIEGVRAIAERGWPDDAWSEGHGKGRPYTSAEREAIQDRARAIVTSQFPMMRR